MSIGEAVGAVLAALGLGGGGVALARRRPVPGSPEEHERRLSELEVKVSTMETWRQVQEHRMQIYEERLEAALDRFSTSIREGVSTLTREFRALRDKVTELDVETTVERELRRQRHQNPETPR